MFKAVNVVAQMEDENTFCSTCVEVDVCAFCDFRDACTTCDQEWCWLIDND